MIPTHTDGRPCRNPEPGAAQSRVTTAFHWLWNTFWPDHLVTMVSLIVLLVSFGLAAAAPQIVESGPCQTYNASLPGRLPITAIPSHYGIQLSLDDPNSASTSFTGSVAITLEVITATSCLVIHSSSGTTVSGAVLSLAGAISLRPTWSFQPETEFLVLSFGETLPLGPAQLEIEYTATVLPPLNPL